VNGAVATARVNGAVEKARRSPLLMQVTEVARRSVIRVARQPASVIPAIAFPLILLAINSSGLGSATKIPGFPTSSYVTFALSFAFIQGAMFGIMVSGQNLGEDNATGFFNRLRLSSIRPSALLAGQLGGVLALALLQAVVFTSVGLLAGVTIATGVGGALVMIALTTLICLAFGSIGIFAGVRANGPEAVMGLFPVMFVFLFLSSMSMPRNLIQTDWFRTIATYNPVSYLVEGVRSLIVFGWDGEALALGFGFGFLILFLGIFGAAASLKNRMARV
jgi:ABC-2 type transport system permease protein